MKVSDRPITSEIIGIEVVSFHLQSLTCYTVFARKQRITFTFVFIHQVNAGSIVLTGQ